MLGLVVFAFVPFESEFGFCTLGLGVGSGVCCLRITVGAEFLILGLAVGVRFKFCGICTEFVGGVGIDATTSGIGCEGIACAGGVGIGANGFKPALEELPLPLGVAISVLVGDLPALPEPSLVTKKGMS